MSEIAYYLRLLIPADKEIKTTAYNISTSAVQIATNLTSGNCRRGFAAYNNSHTDSGEVYWGGSDVTTGNGMPIPKGALFAFPVASGEATNPWIIGDGAGNNVRVIEMA